MMGVLVVSRMGNSMARFRRWRERGQVIYITRDSHRQELVNVVRTLAILCLVYLPAVSLYMLVVT